MLGVEQFRLFGGLVFRTGSSRSTTASRLASKGPRSGLRRVHGFHVPAALPTVWSLPRRMPFGDAPPLAHEPVSRSRLHRARHANSTRTPVSRAALATGFGRFRGGRRHHGAGLAFGRACCPFLWRWVRLGPITEWNHCWRKPVDTHQGHQVSGTPANFASVKQPQSWGHDAGCLSVLSRGCVRAETPTHGRVQCT